jgi:hypothetical protein
MIFGLSWMFDLPFLEILVFYILGIPIFGQIHIMSLDIILFAYIGASVTHAGSPPT